MVTGLTTFRVILPNLDDYVFSVEELGTWASCVYTPTNRDISPVQR